MFVLIDRAGHAIQAPFTGDLVDSLTVYGEIAQWGSILGELGSCSAGKVVVVRGAEEEDAFPVDVRFGPIQDIV